MAVREFPTIGNDGKAIKSLHSDEISRTASVTGQMAGDGLILIILSFVAFTWSIYPHYDVKSVEYLPYFFCTIGTTVIIIFGFARSGVYDVFDDVDYLKILTSTVKCLTVVILLLTACLFVLKISDNVSRLWLGTWSVTSAMALYGFRLITASVVRPHRRGLDNWRDLKRYQPESLATARVS